MPTVPNCGIIPFFRPKVALLEPKAASLEPKVVMIKTPKGRYSFPKGKREGNESDLETACRELTEESGIPAREVSLIRDENGEPITLDELKISEGDKLLPKGSEYIIRYFIGELRSEVQLQVSDPEEIASVEYVNISQVENLPISAARKEVFRRALNYTF